MSKLINEDWEHAAYVNDKLYEAERHHLLMLEWQEWEYEQEQKNKQSAIIIIEKPTKDENTHNPSSVQRTHQEKL